MRACSGMTCATSMPCGAASPTASSPQIIIDPVIELHEPGMLPVYEGKAKRVFDNRPAPCSLTAVPLIGGAFVPSFEG